MRGSGKLRKDIITLYLIVVTSILWLDQFWAGLPRLADGELVFVSDSDSIDAGRASNAAYRIGLDGGGLKRIVGSIPHGDGYLRISDIDCHAASQSLVIASQRHDLNGFYHALLDGSKLHLDRPAAGRLLTSLKHIALAPDGLGVIVSRQFAGFSQPRFGLVGGDLASREYKSIRTPTAERSYVSPVWSPDGGRIAYILERRDKDAGFVYAIAIAHVDGRGERLIHQTSLTIAAIDWSPHGEWIAAAIGRQLYKLRQDGSDLTRLSNHHGGISHPRWSPDSEQISYVAPSSFPGFHQLMVMDADGGNIRRVVNIRGEVVNGCWV